MDGITPFARHLPYWTTAVLAVPTKLDGFADKVCVLVLKDGTVAVGFRVQGLDVYAQSTATLNVQAASLVEALQALPAKMFVQSVFESGHSFAGLLSRYAQADQDKASEILRRGRAERGRMLRACKPLTRCTITYWLGLKGALPKMSAKMLRGALAQTTQQRAAAPLLAAASGFVGALQRMQLRLDVLDEADILAALHRAINPSLRCDSDDQGDGHDGDAASRGSTTPGHIAVPRLPTLSAQLPQSALHVHATQLAVGEPRLLLRAIGVSQWGPSTHPQSLHDVLFRHLPQSGPMRLVITHETTDTDAQRERLSRRQRFISSFVGSRFVDHAAQAALSQHDAVLHSLDNRGSSLLKTSVVAVVSARDAAGLADATRDVIDGFSRQRIAATVYRDEQLPAWLASLPAYGHANPFQHDLLSHNCAHLLPYWLPSLGDDCPDLLFENRQRGLEALSVRLGPVRENAGAIIVGATNSGKTFLFSTLLKYGCLNLGGHVVLADIKGPQNSSYRPLCELLGGTYVCLQSDETISFNPFPPVHEICKKDGTFVGDQLEPAARILCMMTGYGSDVGHEAAYAYSAAYDVLRETYLEHRQSGVQVTLDRIIEAFGDYQGSNATLMRIAQQMCERLENWLKSPMRRRLFGKSKPLELHNRFTVFDFYEMDKDKEAAAVLVSVLASRIEAKMTTLDTTLPKLFGFDEAWALFEQSPEACALLNRLYRVARSYGAFCYILTQSFTDIEHSAAKTGIMANTSLVYLMRHMSQHTQTARAFELTSRQESLFRNLQMVAGEYAEFLLVDRHADKTHLLQYAPTPFDLWCDTSRAVDVHVRQNVLNAAPAQTTLADVIAQLAHLYPRGAPHSEVHIAPTQFWANKKDAINRPNKTNQEVQQVPA